MVNAAFFDIFGIFVFIFLLFLGRIYSKYRLKHVKYGGYLLMIIGLLGLFVDLYNVIYNFIV